MFRYFAGQSMENQHSHRPPGLLLSVLSIASN